MKLRFVAVSAAICIAAGSFIYPDALTIGTPAIVSAKTSKEIDAEKKAKQNEITAKQAELKSLSNSIEQKEKYEQVLQEEISLINSKMLLIDSQLTALNADIETKNNEIALLEGDIANQEVRIAEGLDDFKSRIRTLYIHGNDSLLSALVGAADFYDVLAKMDLINRVAKHDDEMVDTLKEELDTLSKSKEDLTSRQQALKLKVTETEAVRKEFNDSRTELDKAMAETEENRKALEKEKSMTNAELEEYQKEYDKLTAEFDAAVEEEMRKEKERQAKLEAERKAAEEKARKEAEQKKQQQPVVTTAPSNPSTPVTTTVATTPAPQYNGGKLAWPAPGFYHISSPFGPRWGRMHYGIDISDGGIHGSNACAAASGTVVTVRGGCSHDNNTFCGCNWGYGNFVVVSHGNNLYTLYAHLCGISVSEGQTVSTGTVIGQIGSTGNSTGPHLHFGVGVGGWSSSNMVNPMLYLQ